MKYWIAGTSLALSFCLATAAAPRKPNLLFLWTDEQRPDTMAVYGNEKIHAPNLNKFSEECVVFKHAYVTQPVCTPSRGAVMSGLWPHQSGLLDNNIPLGTSFACLPELLNDADYQTGYMGKWHLGDEIFPQHGFKEWVSIEDLYSSHFSEGKDRNQRTDYHQFLVAHGCKPGKDGKFSRDFASHLPIELGKPKFLEQRACDFLRRHREQPFVLYVNFLEPHMPYYGPLNQEHAPALVDVPKSFSAPPDPNTPETYLALRKKYGKGDCADEASLRETVARYWGLVTQVDRSVGVILQTLKELGLADNTLVVYTSDHGDMMGSHGLMAKSVMYEGAVRIPWLMRVPWLGTQSRVITQPVSHIDLVPTVLDLLGSRAGQKLSGQSLAPLMRGEKVAQDHVFIEWNVKPSKARKARKEKQESPDGAEGKEAAGTARFRTVISPDGWKLSLSDSDKHQLFNLNADPEEMRNLFYDGQHREIIERLTEKLHAWQTSVKDPVKITLALPAKGK